jgi:hypothetical protein
MRSSARRAARCAWKRFGLSSRIVGGVVGSTDQFLLNAAAENHRVWFRRTAAADGCSVVDVGDTQLFLGREAMVFPNAGVDVDALIAEIRARECRSVGCWSLSANAALGTRLVARGFGWGWRPHWMAIDLDADLAAAPSRFSVVPAAPPYARTLPYAPSGSEPDGSFRLGAGLD